MFNSYLFSIISATISGFLVLLAAFYLIKPYLERFEKQQLIRLKQASDKETLTLKLQAYERLLLFIDRINPVNMLVRLNKQDYSAGEFHYLILSEIRNEFQHNITQQLYVSKTTWEIITKVKNDTVFLINNAIKAVPAQASALEFSRLILEQFSRMENNPYDYAAGIICDEAGTSC